MKSSNNFGVMAELTEDDQRVFHSQFPILHGISYLSQSDCRGGGCSWCHRESILSHHGNLVRIVYENLYNEKETFSGEHKIK